MTLFVRRYFQVSGREVSENASSASQCHAFTHDKYSTALPSCPIFDQGRGTLAKRILLALGDQIFCSARLAFAGSSGAC